MIDPQDNGTLADDVGRRLRLTRTALGLTQEEFAAKARLSQPRYSPYEAGKRLLTLSAAMALCAAYSLTLDWLYMGDPSGLPYRLHEKIKDLRGQI